MANKATNTVNRKLGVLDIDKLIELLNEKPKIIAMDYPKLYPFKVSELLPDNTIVISQNLARTLGLVEKPEAER